MMREKISGIIGALIGVAVSIVAAPVLLGAMGGLLWLFVWGDGGNKAGVALSSQEWGALLLAPCVIFLAVVTVLGYRCGKEYGNAHPKAISRGLAVLAVMVLAATGIVLRFLSGKGF